MRPRRSRQVRGTRLRLLKRAVARGKARAMAVAEYHAAGGQIDDPADVQILLDYLGALETTCERLEHQTDHEETTQ